MTSLCTRKRKEGYTASEEARKGCYVKGKKENIVGERERRKKSLRQTNMILKTLGVSRVFQST